MFRLCLRVPESLMDRITDGCLLENTFRWVGVLDVVVSMIEVQYNSVLIPSLARGLTLQVLRQCLMYRKATPLFKQSCLLNSCWIFDLEWNYWDGRCFLIVKLHWPWMISVTLQFFKICNSFHKTVMMNNRDGLI